MRGIICLLLLFSISSGWSQEPKKLSATEIFQEIQELNFLGSVLYVAAHPDDENTRLIAYLSNKVNARTAYLSLTRGDGGQNLIGPQLRELLGVLRTQELLAARKIDGGEQFFTRANDFGYSKTPEETLQIWNEPELLKDLVRIYRDFRPDIVINRFNAASAGETHGHHTASAILSKKAFKMAGDPGAFPEQAAEMGTWRPRKLFFNTSPWFYSSPEAFEAASKEGFLEINSGVYYPLSGLSNQEIASLSRSQHRSQGFGSSGTRGKELEYLEIISGDHPAGSDTLFEGIDTSWGRVKGGEKIGAILEEVEKKFDFRDPSKSIPALLEAFSLIQDLEEDHWKKIKSSEIKNVIAACAGLFLEAVAQEQMATPGDKVVVQFEGINRSDQRVLLEGVNIVPTGASLQPSVLLKNNTSWKVSTHFIVPPDTQYTSPYWLRKKGSLGMYHVEDPDLTGLPDNPAPFVAAFHLRINGQPIIFHKEIIYKKTDPVLGEIYKPFEIVPPVSVSMQSDIVVFADQESKFVPVKIRALTDAVSGTLQLDSLDRWSATPASFSFGPLQKGEEVSFNFQVSPPDLQNTRILQPIVTIGQEQYSKQVIQLDYPHISSQTLVLPAETKLVRLNIKKQGNRIGYIVGAGDVVPEALEQIGYSVEKISPNAISAKGLEKYDAVVLGIRAYNTVPALRYKQDQLFEYVRRGGTLISQYNTNRSLVTDTLAPYSLQISRDRVTDEQAEVVLINKDHPILNRPNKIISADFEGWVQERGLYFPGQWGQEFTPVLSMHDPQEPPLNGSLLAAPFGDGYFVYTGLSFFRQLPAGVPGAYRLFANLISLGNKPTSAASTKKFPER